MTLRRTGSACALAALVFVAPARASDGEFDRDGSYKTTNFRTYAANKEMAQKFGDMAEHYRVEKAREWLGREMPAWPQRCPLRVKVTMGQAGGATTFTFGQDTTGRSAVSSQQMEISGDVKQLLYSVLPHEVTHTVLAFHFGRPVPRWADEGGSVLSENEEECFTHDIRCREILNQGRGMRLRYLFGLKEYPRDMIVVYAQGYSVCRFLVERGGRSKLLQFIGVGMRGDGRNWDEAVREVYGFDGVDDMEEKWIDTLRTPPQRVAARPKDKADGGTQLASRPQVRSSAAPGMPMLEPPAVVRGAAPDEVRPSPRTAEARPAVRRDDLPRLLPPEPAGRP